jgi:sugar/nucleoside kinase (ribokinase family)
MRRLGVVGLTALDRVDGGPPRVGGAAFYCARALRFLGQRAVIATKFAEGDRDLVAPLHALGLPVVARPAKTTIAFRIDNRGEERSMAVEELGAVWAPEEVRGWLANALAGVDWVHAGALTRADFPAATLQALRRTRVVSLDAQALVRPARRGALTLDPDFDREVLRHVDVLKVGEEEAAVLGITPEERSLRSLGVPEVVFTLGSRGAVVFADGLAELVPTRPLYGIDATGAGDEFIAVYLAFRRSGHGPPSAARCANDVAYALLSGCPGR